MNRQNKDQFKNNLKDPKVSYELFQLTYGAFIAQILKDYECIDDVNRQLDSIGYNIGIRLIEDFLSRTQITQRCVDMKEVAECLSQKAFKMYLGIQPIVQFNSTNSDEFSLILETNPLIDFIELPLNDCTIQLDNLNDNDNNNKLNKLNYSQIICGCLRGALEMIQLRVECYIGNDHLKGDKHTEIKIKFIEKLKDAIPIGED